MNLNICFKVLVALFARWESICGYFVKFALIPDPRCYFTKFQIFEHLREFGYNFNTD